MPAPYAPNRPDKGWRNNKRRNQNSQSQASSTPSGNSALIAEDHGDNVHVNSASAHSFCAASSRALQKGLSPIQLTAADADKALAANLNLPTVPGASVSFNPVAQVAEFGSLSPPVSRRPETRSSLKGGTTARSSKLPEPPLPPPESSRAPAGPHSASE